MEAAVKIGDTSLVITAVQRAPGDTSHSITAIDAWECETEVHVVEDEPAAIAVLAAFLELDGPGKAFSDLFEKDEFRAGIEGNSESNE